MGVKVNIGNVARSPKSTVIGLCVLALAAERGVHFDTLGHLNMTARDWFDVGCGLITAVLSGLSQDGHGSPHETAVSAEQEAATPLV